MIYFHLMLNEIIKFEWLPNGNSSSWLQVRCTANWISAVTLAIQCAASSFRATAAAVEFVCFPQLWMERNALWPLVQNKLMRWKLSS